MDLSTNHPDHSRDDESPDGGVTGDATSTTRAESSRFAGVLTGVATGVLAAAVGLGVAELIAGLHDGWRSPVLDVGDRVIDRVPQNVKQLAIDWFGTNDKKALLIGIGSLLAIYAAVIGVLAVRRSLRWGVIGVGLFGALGAVCAVSARTNPPIHVAVPSLIGAVAAAGVMVALLRPARASSADAGVPPAGDAGTEPAADDGDAVATSETSGLLGVGRRRFLLLSGGFVGVAAATAASGRWLQSRFDAAASRAALVLPRARKPLAAADAAAHADGAVPFFTPNEDFYRIDINLTVPRISPEQWSLRVHGMVDNEITLSYDELVERELIERDITLTCVSNEVGGKLLGTARWLGVRLDDLLAEAGISPDADQVVGRSVDGYTCGFPVSALDGRDALIAIAMNGEPLPLEHGFPARLIVPGLYGYVSATKWLTEIELSRFDELDQYWVPRGWDAEAPIKTSSRIDTPKGLSRVAPGTVAIAGVAWAQTRGIDAVQVRIDDGDWAEADLAAEVNDTTWRQWSYAWTAEPGRHEVTVRAVDRDGDVQVEDRQEPFPNGSTGWHSIVVLVDG